MRFLFFFVCFLYSLQLFAQTILIGTADSGPPFAIAAKDNIFYGFEIDLMKEICQRAQLECRFSTFTFSDLFDEVQEGHINLAIGTITITPDRQRKFLFSLPYLIGGGQYATQVSSPVKTINDIKGKVVGIEKGTIFKAWVESQFGDTTQVKEFNTLADVLQALKDNKVDVVLHDSSMIEYWIANSSDQIRTVGAPIGSGYAIMTTKDNEALISTINKYLLELENDGTYLKLYQRYF